MKSQCPACANLGKDNSHDNLVEYEDGYFCHSCGYLDKEKDNIMQLLPKDKQELSIIVGECRSIEHRGISLKTAQFFDYQIGKYQGEDAHIANYKDQFGTIVAQKVRQSNKRFKITGESNKMGLYGQWLWEASPNVFVTVVEGELDALSVAEAQGTQFPVVSVPKGANGARKAIQGSLEWLNKWKHVVLAFDSDEPGRRAAEECIDLFEPGKVRIAKWTKKDANEVLITEQFASKIIQQTLFNASIVNTSNIIEPSEVTLEEIAELATTGYELPFPKLNYMINGLRQQHLYTIVAREKCGKTSLTKEIALHLSKQGLKIGLLYLEENATKEAISLWAMQENMPMWKVENDLKNEKFQLKVKKGLESFKNSGLYLYNHKGAIDALSVQKSMIYMTKSLGCQVVILDNISISVAGTTGENERKQIDKMVFDLVGLINQTKCTIINIVHAVKNRKNSDGQDSEEITRADIFGSGAFAKFSHVVLGLERGENNTVTIKVLANRDKGVEGYSDTLYYNQNTGRLDLQKELPKEARNDSNI